MRPVDSLLVRVCTLACLAIATGCSQSEQSLAQLASSYEFPDYAQRFRWRALDGGNCMEVITANHEVLATVYRDSSDFLNDAARGQQSVILGSTQTGLATLSSTHVALMEPWDSTLAHWKGGGYLDYVRSRCGCSADCWKRGVGLWRKSGMEPRGHPGFRFSGLLHLSLRKPAGRGYLGRRPAGGSHLGIR